MPAPPWERSISRRRFVELAGKSAAFVGSSMILPAVATERASGGTEPSNPLPVAGGTSVVVRWNEAVLQGVRESTLGPPMIARALAVIHTCMYDAWAAYEARAVGTRLGGDRVGNVASAAVLTFRHQDGANQLGDEPGGTGEAYSDYTGYSPVNDPMDLRFPFDPATVHDPNRWQPLRFVGSGGSVVTQRFIAPHWDRVLPFALTSATQFRSASGPATFGTGMFRSQALEVIHQSAALTDRTKMIVEYWMDGPRSELPPGHWNLFAQFVAGRDQ